MDVSGKDRDPALSLLRTAYSVYMPTMRAIYSTIYRYANFMIITLIS